jgi:hypothetical protein
MQRGGKFQSCPLKRLVAGTKVEAGTHLPSRLTSRIAHRYVAAGKSTMKGSLIQLRFTSSMRA